MGFHAPSLPVDAVALTALVVALGGTATAATSLVNGDKLIKKGTLSGNRLRRHTITGTQVNLSKLGQVPSARKAAMAANANNATNAGHAASADTATNATNAGNASQLGGLPPSAFQSRVRWALINGSGTIVAQSGGITSTRTSTGLYVFGLGVSVAGMSFVATPDPAFTTTGRIDISVSPCGTDSTAGETNCGGSFNDGQHVYAEAADSYSTTSGNQDEGFYIDFIG